MDICLHSLDSLPDTTHLLSARKSLPPKSRSPIKTSIGSPRKSLNGSPRKSLGLLNSPIRFGNRTPTTSQILTQDDPSSILDIATEEIRHSIEKSPQRPQRPIEHDVIGLSPSIAPSKAMQRPKQNRKRPFDISPDKEEEDTPLDTQPEIQIENSTAEDATVMNGDDELDMPEDEYQADEDDADKIPPSKPVPKPTGRRGRPKVTREEDVTQESIEEEPEEQAEPEPELEEDAEEETPEAEPEPTPQIKKRRGRPPKAAKQDTTISKPAAVYRDLEESVDEPLKPAKRSRIEETAAASSSTPIRQRSAGAERDPNALIKSKKNKEKESRSPSASMLPPPKPMGTTVRGKPKARSLQILRSTTPSDVDGARFTRSGRASVKPIEYWRGERIIYTEPKRDGPRLSLPGIKEVIRAEDVSEDPKPRSRKRAPGKRKAVVEEDEEEEEEDPDVEEWEVDPGLLEGEVLQWDPDAQRASQDVAEQIGKYEYFLEKLEIFSFPCLMSLIKSYSQSPQLPNPFANLYSDLAIAPKGLDTLMKEVKNQNFQYAKTITLPFFHSGVVDIPPGGEKRQKNSRKNHMVFWVFSGRVTVDVSGNEFGLGKGGMWQVPRGKC